MRIRGYDEETEEFKDDVEELSGAIADLTKTAKHPGGVSLFRDAAKTEFKSTYEVLRDISNIYDELTDKQQAQVLEKLAGKRGGQVLAGILSPEKFEEVKRALREMSDAAGAADAEMGIVEESIQFKLNALQQTWVGILQELVDRGTIGNLIDALTKISEGIATITENSTKLKAVLSSLVGLYASFKGVGFLDHQTTQGNLKSGIISNLKSLGNLGLSQQAISLGINQKDVKLLNDYKSLMGSISIATDNTAHATQAWNSTIATGSNALQTYVLDAQQGGVAISALGDELVNVEFKTKALAIATNLLNAAITTGLIVGITLLVSSTVKLLSAIKNVDSEVGKLAKKVGSDFDAISEDINKYKNEIQDLRDKLNDSNTPHEESVEIRKRLLSIQEELIKKYGDEAGAINDITAALTGEIDALDKISDKKWREKINEFNDDSDLSWDQKTAKQLWRNENNARTNFDALMNEMATKSYKMNVSNLDPAVKAFLLEQEGVQIKRIGIQNGKTVDEIEVTGDSLQDVYNRLIDIQNATDGLDSIGTFSQEASKHVNQLNTKLTDNASLYEEGVLRQYISGSKYEQELEKAQKAYDDYTKAFTEGNEESANKAKDELKSIISDVYSSLDVVLMQDDDAQAQKQAQAIKDYFANTFELANNEIQKEQFKIDYAIELEPSFIGDKNDDSIVTDSKDKRIKRDNIRKALNQFSSKEDITNYDISTATKEQKEAYSLLSKEASKYKMSIEEIVDALDEMYNLNYAKRNNATATRVAGGLSKAHANKGQYITPFSDISEFSNALQRVSQEDFNLVSTFTDEQFINIENHYNAIREELGDTISKSEAWAQATREVCNEVQKVNAETQKETKEFNAQDFSENLTSKLGSLHNAYQNFYDNVVKGEQKVFDLDEFEGLRSSLVKGTEDEHGNKALYGIDEETFNRYRDIITNTTYSIEEQEQAWDDLSTALANSYYEQAIAESGKLDEKTKQLIEDQITLKGYTKESAEAFIESRQALGSFGDSIRKNLQNEYDKIHDFDLDKYAEEIKNKTIGESLGFKDNKFGNIDMDKRAIIQWSNELKETYKNELKSWQYDPEIGSIDTVFGGSDAFKIDDIEIEVAYTPIMEVDDGAELLGEKTVKDYIQSILDEASTDGDWSIAEILKLDERGSMANVYDEQGRVIGKKLVHGIIAGAGEDAIDLGKILHFSGESGAIQIAEQQIRELEAAEEALKNKGIELENATVRDISVLRTEGVVGQQVAEQLKLYAIQKQIIDGIPIDSGDDVAALYTLAVECGIAKEQLQQLEAVLKGYDEADAAAAVGHMADADAIRRQTWERSKKAVQDVADEVKNTLVSGLDTVTSKVKDTGGAAKDTAEDTIDLLSKINSQIDEIQDSYQKLEKIQESYNSTGKISIDQAQELSNMDFRYLAQLDLTTGALDLQKDAWDKLTEAKINDLKIAMIQKALDLISTFKNEAVAIEYLGNSYIDAANKALTLAQAQAQVAEMNLGENGQKAADAVMRGLENALAMIDHVDLNLHTESGSERESGGGGHEPSGKTPEQEAFEEEVKEAEEKLQITYKDWMEVALDKVGKKVDKWTKSIDKMFTFWNKQWATNKAIGAIREEVSMQQSAYNLYLKQANKAAKKAGRYIEKDEESLTYEILGTEGLKKRYKDLLKYGAEKIGSFNGSKKDQLILAKIEAYAEWYNKALEAQEKIAELYEQERELIKQKLDNIVSYYDTIENYLNSAVGRLDAALNLKEAKGQRTSIQDLLKQYQVQEPIVKNAKDALTALTVGLTEESAREKSEVQSELDSFGEKFDANIKNDNYTTKATNKRNKLQEKLDNYNKYLEEAANASTKKEQKALKKEAKKYKLSSNEKSLLNALNKNLDSITQLQQDAIVDSATANTATYQNLVKQINKLQKKKKLSAKNQKKLNKYLDELNALNQNVNADDVTEYNKIYKEWWDLQQELQKKGYFKDKKKYTKLDTLTKQKDALEKAHTDRIKALQEEMKQLDALDQDTIENLNIERDKELAELEESYDKQSQNILSGYTNKADYKNKKATFQQLTDKLAKKGKLGKTDKATLNKLTAEMKAFEKGATEENYAQFKSIWEEWYDLDQKRDKNGKLKLKGKDVTRYDELYAQLQKMYEDKKANLDNIDKEKTEEINRRKQEWKAKIEDAKAEIDNAITKQYEIVKQIAEKEIQDIQYLIDDLDSMINRFKSVAELYENVSLGDINKYSGLKSLFEISGNDAISIIKDQLNKAIKDEEDKISRSVQQGELYKKLISAANSSDFKGVLSNYRASLTDQEDIDTLDSVIADLEASGKSATAWISEWNSNLNTVISNVSTSIQDVQKLKDELRENVYFKAIQNAIEQTDALSQKTSSLTSLFRDEWMFDSEGITEFGKAKAKSLLNEYALAKEQIENYANDIKQIEQAWNDGAYGTNEEQYQKDLLSAQKTYTDGLRQQEDLWVQIADISKKVQEEDINQIKKAADAYQKALQNKKAYWQYSQNIKSKTKEIEALRAEIDALNGVNTAETKALEAQKQAALEAAQEELENMQMEHAFDLSADALNKFVEDLESSLDTSTQKIAETFKDIIENFGKTVELAKTADIASTLNTITHAMSDGSVNTTVTKIDTPDSSASSSVAIPEDSLSINQYVRMDEKTFINSLKTSLTDTVTPKLNTINNSLSSISTSLQKGTSTAWIQKIHDTLTKQIQPSISDISKSLLKENATGNVTVNINYDSLMTVNGSVDSTIVSNMNKMTTDLISKTKDSIYKDLRKNGVNITY